MPAMVWTQSLKNIDVSRVRRGVKGDLPERHMSEQTIARQFAILIRNTTWRCGKLEKSIVKHLHKKRENLGKTGIPVSDMMHNLDLTGEKKNEFLDALRRLEKRHIVRLRPL